MFKSPCLHLVFSALYLVAIDVIVARASATKLEHEWMPPSSKSQPAHEPGRLRRKWNDDDDDNDDDKNHDTESSPIAISKQLFQDIFTEHGNDDKLQFGYVCENPDQWEQRFEEKDLRNNRHRGKVKWGNVDGGYGEHYWDINYK